MVYSSRLDGADPSIAPHRNEDELNSRVIETGRLATRFVQAGSGPDVLLIAGLSDDSASWEPQMAHLAQRFTVTAIDNRGAGGTRAPEGPITAAMMSVDTVAAMDALSIPIAHVVGNSMGGAIAQELALLVPERVRSLVLSGTWCRSDPLFREVISTWKHASSAGLDRRVALRSIFTWCVAPRFYETGLVGAWIDEMVDAGGGQTADEFRRQCDAVLEHDTLDRLVGMRCPTLVLHGEEDILVGRRHALEILERLPHSASVVLPGVGHCPNLEDASNFDAVLERFWASL